MNDSAVGTPARGFYLFCLARSSLVPAVVGEGLDGRTPLLSQRFLDIAAVVTLVSVDDFCGPEAESRMQDLSWIGPRACRHEEVVEGVMGLSPVLPAPFGTLFSSAASLEKWMAEHYGAVTEFLHQVGDKQEWAVKGFLDRGKARDEILSTLLANESESLASLSPGNRYLQEQRIRSGAEKELNGWLKELSKGIANDLQKNSSDFRERRVLSNKGPDGRGMIWNWAFLVPRGEAAEFRLRIERVNAEYGPRGLVLELDGPWPPYSFSPFLEAVPET
jgi:hypothetical protein